MYECDEPELESPELCYCTMLLYTGPYYLETIVPMRTVNIRDAKDFWWQLVCPEMAEDPRKWLKSGSSPEHWTKGGWKAVGRSRGPHGALLASDCPRNSRGVPRGDISTRASSYCTDGTRRPKGEQPCQGVTSLGTPTYGRGTWCILREKHKEKDNT
ncbi:hypothetical protein J6590_011701 [Homalodisca vitripennis]|nr:hypothetical protein J6590_011701 [Homalodisca vitripennis]